MFVLFVDDASRYITVFLLNRKSETGACFMEYDKLCLNRTGRHVQVLRSNGETCASPALKWGKCFLQ